MFYSGNGAKLIEAGLDQFIDMRDEKQLCVKEYTSVSCSGFNVDRERMCACVYY